MPWYLFRQRLGDSFAAFEAYDGYSDPDSRVQRPHQPFLAYLLMDLCHST